MLLPWRKSISLTVFVSIQLSSVYIYIYIWSMLDTLAYNEASSISSQIFGETKRVTLRRKSSEIRSTVIENLLTICAMQGRNDKWRWCSRKLADPSLSLSLFLSRKELTGCAIVSSTFITKDRSRRGFAKHSIILSRHEPGIRAFAKDISRVDRRIQRWY